MFDQRPTFGGVSSSFGGFGSSNTAGSGFGSSTFGRSTFGSPQTTSSSTPFSMGAPSGTSLFGQNQQSSGGLFGSQSSTFGTSSGFGSGASTRTGGFFANSSTQPGSSGLFGSSTTSGFSANQNQQKSFIFGTSTTSSGTGTSLFGSSSSGGLFSSAQQAGTSIKFNPLTGSDTMVNKDGESQTIKTKIMNICSMEAYVNKSLEELRFEDYNIAGRKGGQQQQQSQGFGFSNKLGSQPTSSSSWLSQPSTIGGGFFNKPPENKPLFGSQSTTGFGTSSSGGLFGSSTSVPFGQSTTAGSTGFSFGQTTQVKNNVFPFSQTTTSSSLFGQGGMQSGTKFGTSPGFGFGNQNTQQGGIFGQNKPAFGTSTSSTSLFNKPTGPTFGFGNTSSASSPFGASNTGGGGIFGSANQSKPAFSLGSGTTSFGTSTGFGTGGGLFGNTANQPKPGGINFGTGSGFGSSSQSSGFSFNPPSSGSLFGNTSTTGNIGGSGGGLFGGANTSNFGNAGIGSSNFGTGTFNFNQPSLLSGNANLNSVNNANNIVNSSNIGNLIKALTHNPFGMSSLLKSPSALTGKADELLNSPSSKTATANAAPNPSKSVLSNGTPTYVLPSGTAASNKLKPVSLNQSFSGVAEESTKKKMLFVGLDDKFDSPNEDPFRIKPFPSVKRLSLKAFKSSKLNGSYNSSLEQSTAASSLINENLNPTYPVSENNKAADGLQETPETPSNRFSNTPLEGSSPTPDIIKGPTNMKLLQMVNKENMNDTIADMNVGGCRGSGGITAEGVRSSNNSSRVGSLHDVSNRHNVSELEGVSFFGSQGPEEGPDSLNTTTTPHPAGIKLHRAGYYTIPSLEDLGEMVDDSGKCLVENFTVGRYGYGNVCFQGITDVSGLDLDSIVFIVRKEVEVYPEGAAKPAVGEGLNKASYITLDCVWPVDKSTHEVIKCQERLDAMGWPQYLERQCPKMGATFVEYRPESGSWVFRVKHFSKYGLQDEENEPPQSSTSLSTTTTLHPNSLQQPLAPLQSKIMDTSIVGKENIPLAKTPLSISNYSQSTPPHLGGNVRSEPPSFGLDGSRSIGTVENQQSPAVRKRVFLDESSMWEEDEAFELAEKECSGLDDFPMHPFSPSAERLALSSKAPATAIQSLKSQLFFEENENDLDLADIRDAPPISASSFSFSRDSRAKRMYPSSSNEDLGGTSYSTSFISSKDFSKTSIKQSRGDEPSLRERTLVGGSAVDMEITRLENYIDYSNYSSSVNAKEEQLTKEIEGAASVLRDPRTEYQLLASCSVSQYDDLEKEPLSHLSFHIPLENSLVCPNTKIVCDMAWFKGRSFRVGWGPGLTLVHCGRPLGQPSSSSSSQFEFENESIQEPPNVPSYLFSGQEATENRRTLISAATAASSTVEQNTLVIEKFKSQILYPDSSHDLNILLEACLKDVLECSILKLPSTQKTCSTSSTAFDANESEESLEKSFSCPYFVPRKSVELLHRLRKTASDLSPQMESMKRDVDGGFTPMSKVFSLCAALWGKLPFYSSDIDGTSHYVQEQARKEALSIWLENISQQTVAVETERGLLSGGDEDYLDAVFSYLTARQISKACEICQDRGDHHLALLISQSCLSDERPRQIMRDQLSIWAWSGLDAHMSMSRLMLFTLMAGTTVHQSSQGPVNTFLGLDWSRCLAILLWYICPATSSIGEVLAEYEKAAGISKGDFSICQSPFPPYTHEQPVMIDNVKVNYDICFQLLKLYTDSSQSLEKLLETSSYSFDPMNVSTSWFVWSILSSLDYTLLPSSKVESLHVSMATNLESSGWWHWAAFVILSIPNEGRRISHLMDLLSKYLLVEGENGCTNEEYIQKERFVLNKLQVPLVMVYKAKAIKAKSLRLVDEEAWYLLQAGKFNDAHSLILESIAPNAIINEDLEHLRAYLLEFQRLEASDHVTGWKDGCGIYMAYLEVVDQVDEIKETRSATASKVEKLRPRLMALCLRLNNLALATPVHKLCISQMSKMAISVLRALMIETPDAIRVLAQQVASLPLIHETALEELNHITHQYLSSLSSADVDPTKEREVAMES